MSVPVISPQIATIIDRFVLRSGPSLRAIDDMIATEFPSDPDGMYVTVLASRLRTVLARTPPDQQSTAAFVINALLADSTFNYRLQPVEGPQDQHKSEDVGVTDPRLVAALRLIAALRDMLGHLESGDARREQMMALLAELEQQHRTQLWRPAQEADVAGVHQERKGGSS